MTDTLVRQDVRPARLLPLLRATTLLLVLLALGAAAIWWLAFRPGSQTGGGRAGHGTDPIPVLLAPVQKLDVPIYLDGLGTAQASATVTVKPQVDGVLLDVPVHEGQDVHVGDVLAHIDPRTYQAALDQAIAKKAQDQANLANARVDLTRYTKLAATAYTSAQQADTQRAMVAQLEAQVAQDQAQIDNARAQLSYTTIRAPIDGRVGIRQVDAGNIVHAVDASGIFVITTLKPISVIFTLPQQNLAAVARAARAGPPEALALPQGDELIAAAPAGTARAARQPLDQGKLTVLDNQVDQTTGTIKLKAIFPNTDLALWPGAFVNIRLKVEEVHGAIVVPPAAVQRGPNGAYVYVVGDDLLARRVPVQAGHEDLDRTIITDGLQPGQRVVVDGAARLSDKAGVSVAPAPGAPALP